MKVHVSRLMYVYKKNEKDFLGDASVKAKQKNITDIHNQDNEVGIFGIENEERMFGKFSTYRIDRNHKNARKI